MSSMPLSELNRLSETAFTEHLGAIFEHAPWIARQTWKKAPWSSRAALHAALCQTLAAADTDAKLALIRAHPTLAGKAAVRGELTADSTQEQRSAGLDACSPEEFALLQELNAAYQARFGIPFILAVRGHTRTSIITLLAQRLNHEPEAEINEALRQIELIAAFRLADRVHEDS